ncbi:MAG: hypothetical protein CM15mV5_0230 [uncultured marine virus]|nr:MAG: hypothetical protein CM15mV5_0230 [uncultured marine virus]
MISMISKMYISMGVIVSGSYNPSGSGNTGISNGSVDTTLYI